MTFSSFSSENRQSIIYIHSAVKVWWRFDNQPLSTWFIDFLFKSSEFLILRCYFMTHKVYKKLRKNSLKRNLGRQKIALFVCVMTRRCSLILVG